MNIEKRIERLEELAGQRTPDHIVVVELPQHVTPEHRRTVRVAIATGVPQANTPPTTEGNK